MPSTRAVQLLDPRPAAAASARPIVASVNIPATELPARLHELPPKHRPIHIAAVGGDAATVEAWLRAGGRAAHLTPEFEYSASNGPAAPALTNRLWAPAEFLSEIAPQLRPGAALDVACGSGRDAVYLAAEGWTVMAVDLLSDALVLAADLERRYARSAAAIHWLHADLEAAAGPQQLADPAKPLDFTARFDLVCAFRYLHRPLFADLRRWLSPGGSLVYETFTTLHQQRHGKPARTAHVLQPDELPILAGPGRVRHYSEAWRPDGAHTARLWWVAGPT